jgi:hypothetical protein
MCNAEVKVLIVKLQSQWIFREAERGTHYHFPAFTAVEHAATTIDANVLHSPRRRHTNFAKLLR